MNFPDPNDRTPNQPCILLSPTDVLKICKKLMTNNSTAVTEKMREALVKEALRAGWTGATFLGHQCLLHASFFGAPDLVFPK